MVGALAGCDEGTSQQQPVGSHPPRLIAVAAGPSARPCAAPEGFFGCLENVGVRPLVVLRFDVPLSPSSVSRANVHIASGAFSDVATRQIRVDPVDRLLVISLDRELRPNASYQLVLANTGGPSNELASIDGAPFAGTVYFALRTAPAGAASDPIATDPDPWKVDPCAARAVLTRCASCHGDATDAGVAAVGLRLATWAGVSSTAIGAPALEVARESSNAPNVSATGDFPRGLARIAPFDSNDSFLLWKLLAGGPTIDRAEPCTPLGTPRWFSVGDVTSPETAVSSVVAPLIPGDVSARHFGAVPTISELRVLRGWIDQGASQWPDSCPDVDPTRCDSIGGAADAGGSDGAVRDAGDAASD